MSVVTVPKIVGTLLLPDQTGHTGEALFTDGSSVYWSASGGGGSSTFAGLTDIADSLVPAVDIHTQLDGSVITFSAADTLGTTSSQIAIGSGYARLQAVAPGGQVAQFEARTSGSTGYIYEVGGRTVEYTTYTTETDLGANRSHHVFSAVPGGTVNIDATLQRDVFWITLLNIGGSITFTGVGGETFNSAGTITLEANKTYAFVGADGLSNYSVFASGSYQPLDSDLTTIAGLTATTDNFMQAKGSAWASRTIAQVKTDLAISNVDNTSDTNKPVSTAQATADALNLKIASNLSDLNNASTARGNLGLGSLATQSGTFSGSSSGTNTGDQVIKFAFGTELQSSDIVVGGKAYVRVPYAGTITGWTIETKNQSGSIVFDVWKGSSFPTAPTISNTIVASAKPTLTTATGVTSTSIGTWTSTTFATGDYFVFNIDSFTTLTWVKVSIEGTRS